MSSKSRSKKGTPSEKKGLSPLTTGKLLQFLAKAGETERKLQIVKEMLCQEEEFHPVSLFHRLDCAEKGYLTEQDIDRFLRQNQISLKGSDLKLLYGRLNQCKESQRITPRHFTNAILPNQNPHLRYFAMHRPIFIPLPHEKLNHKIQWITNKFFSQTIAQYAELSKCAHSFVSSFDFDPNVVFATIAEGRDVICAKDIVRFCTENGLQLSPEEVGCVIRVMDQRGQGQISKDEFKDFVATQRLKKQHQIFDQLSPIPALKDFDVYQLNFKEREASLKERYKDNKSYAKKHQEYYKQEIRQDQRRVGRGMKLKQT